MLAVLPVRVASNISTVVLQTDNMLYQKDENIETESKGKTRTKRDQGSYRGCISSCKAKEKDSQ